MLFAPIAKGTPEIVHAEGEPAAVPDPPLDDIQVTTMPPVPPDAAPERLTVDAAVDAGRALTLRVNGDPAGARSCGAYSVWIAAISGGAS